MPHSAGSRSASSSPPSSRSRAPPPSLGPRPGAARLADHRRSDEPARRAAAAGARRPGPVGADDRRRPGAAPTSASRASAPRSPTPRRTCSPARPIATRSCATLFDPRARPRPQLPAPADGRLGLRRRRRTTPTTTSPPARPTSACSTSRSPTTARRSCRCCARRCALNPNLKVMATPWSPPAWMKTNDSLVGGRFKDDPRVYDAYARYFVRFVQEYRRAGVPIDAVTLQNEPQNRNPSAYPGMDLRDDEEARLVVAVGRAFQRAGIAHEDPRLRPQLVAAPQRRRAARRSGQPGVRGVAALQPGRAPLPRRHRVPLLLRRPRAPVRAARRLPAEGHLLHRVLGLAVGRSGDDVPRHPALAHALPHRRRRPQLGQDGHHLEPRARPVRRAAQRRLRHVLRRRHDRSRPPATRRRPPTTTSSGHVTRFIRPGAVRIDSTVAGNAWNVAFRNPDGSIVLVVVNDDWGTTTQRFNVSAGGTAFSYDAAGGRGGDLRAARGASRLTCPHHPPIGGSAAPTAPATALQSRYASGPPRRGREASRRARGGCPAAPPPARDRCAVRRSARPAAAPRRRAHAANSSAGSGRLKW